MIFNLCSRSESPPPPACPVLLRTPRMVRTWAWSGAASTGPPPAPHRIGLHTCHYLVGRGVKIQRCGAQSPRPSLRMERPPARCPGHLLCASRGVAAQGKGPTGRQSDLQEPRVRSRRWTIGRWPHLGSTVQWERLSRRSVENDGLCAADLEELLRESQSLPARKPERDPLGGGGGGGGGLEAGLWEGRAEAVHILRSAAPTAVSNTSYIYSHHLGTPGSALHNLPSGWASLAPRCRRGCRPSRTSQVILLGSLIVQPHHSCQDFYEP